SLTAASRTLLLVSKEYGIRASLTAERIREAVDLLTPASLATSSKVGAAFNVFSGYKSSIIAINQLTQRVRCEELADRFYQKHETQNPRRRQFEHGHGHQC